MKEDLGIEITPQAIAFYDPTRYSTSPCPKRWSDLFWTMRAEFIASVPIGRLSQPRDVANAALYLASDEADFITGACIEVDGGRCV